MNKKYVLHYVLQILKFKIIFPLANKTSDCLGNPSKILPNVQSIFGFNVSLSEC